MSEAEIVNLSTPYAQVAVYYEEADRVEYVRIDESLLYERVDDFLTLIFSLSRRDELVGFQLKGFKNFCLSDPVSQRLGSGFYSLVGMLERAVGAIGEDVLDDDRMRAYASARDMALADRVSLSGIPMRAQA